MITKLFIPYKGPTIQRFMHVFVTMANNTTDQVLVCWQLLATFFHGIKYAHTHWFPIVLREGSSKANDHGLASLMLLNYSDTYLLLMIVCSLIIKQCIKKGLINQWKFLVFLRDRTRSATLEMTS